MVLLFTASHRGKVLKKQQAHNTYEVDRGSSLPPEHIGAATPAVLDRLSAGATHVFDVSDNRGFKTIFRFARVVLGCTHVVTGSPAHV
jgi:hypothetical protein